LFIGTFFKIAIEAALAGYPPARIRTGNFHCIRLEQTSRATQGSGSRGSILTNLRLHYRHEYYHSLCLDLSNLLPVFTTSSETKDLQFMPNKVGREVHQEKSACFRITHSCYPRTITSGAFAFSLSYSHSPIEDLTIPLPDFRRRLGLTVS
jgi:hypothetical protein